MINVPDEKKRSGSGGKPAQWLSAWLVLWFESSYCQQLCGVAGQFIKVPADRSLSLSVSREIVETKREI